jgi:hypothetical protein
MVLPSPENENVLSLDESKHNELERQNISATHLMKQLSQAKSWGSDWTLHRWSSVSAVVHLRLCRVLSVSRKEVER